MVGKILMTPLLVIKWALLVILGGFLGVLISVGLDLAGAVRLVEFVPRLAEFSEHVPSFLCGAFGGLIIGKLVFRRKRATKSGADKVSEKGKPL